MITTEELFDCSIDEMTLNARTRGALSKAGITTLSGLEQAFLSGGPPGIGPKGAADIEQAFDALGADLDARRAAGAIYEEHSRLANLLMHTTDLMLSVDAEHTSKRLNEQNIRKATADLLRDSLRKTVDALLLLVPQLRDELPWDTAESGDA